MAPKEKENKENKDKDGDVEMKDAEEKKEEKKEPEKTPEEKLLIEVVQSIRGIATMVLTKEYRTINRVMRQFAPIRRKLPEVAPYILGYVAKQCLKCLPASEGGSELLNIIVNEGNMASPPELPAIENMPNMQPCLAEVECFLLSLRCAMAIDKKDINLARKIVDQGVAKMQNLNRRTLDQLTGRLYFYYSRVYELQGKILEVRTSLLAFYRSACLHHDTFGQATLVNLILRNYIVNSHYDQASKFLAKTTFPEARSNAQYARYLYYVGRVRAVQLEYTSAHTKLTAAVRKAPTSGTIGKGFRLTATKFAVIVELLTGEIPDRALFNDDEMKTELKPYLAIVLAVRGGDLNQFSNVMKTHEALFKKDDTYMLIQRLRHNVIKAGLRSLSHAYSRISLQDVCKSLGLGSEEEAAGVVSKAVVDGVIDATIDHAGRSMNSKWAENLFRSSEPQRALHKRVAFCLDLHNDLVKAMAYPADKKDQAAIDAELREREQALMAALEEEDDDEMEF